MLHKHSNGLSIIELAVAMAVLGVVGLGVSAILQLILNSQLISQSQQTQQSIAFSILPQLRADLLAADNLQILGNGNQIQFRRLTASGSSTVRYSYTNGTLNRRENGVTRSFLPPASTFSISCSTPCFEETRDASGAIVTISLKNMSVRDSKFPNKQGLTFPVQEATFSVVNGNKIQ